jgi:hypothetical protein
MRRCRRWTTSIFGGGALATLFAGCGDGAPGAVPDGSTSEPLYALVTLVWSDEGPTGYVALTKTLDVPNVALEQAREFPGYTSVGVVDGHLLVNPSAEDPTIHRYQIDDDLGWADRGTLSFANEGVESVGFFTQYIRRDHEAYLDVDVTGRVIWDPVAFTILGRSADRVLPLQRDGLDLFANFNRTYFAFAGDVLRPFSYHAQDWFTWGSDSKIVVYDAVTRDPKNVIDAGCPGLDTITRDESGNTYLGSWEYPALHPLMGTGAPPCVTRLTPDNSVDASWNTDLGDMTGGRLAVNFRYIGSGKAIAAVLHAEEYGPDFDFAGLAANVDNFWSTASHFHRLWMFDIGARAAAPVSGVEAFPFVNPGFFHAAIDGRTFVFLGDGSTNNPPETVVYEVGAGGPATRRFAVPGTVTQWVRIR